MALRMVLSRRQEAAPAGRKLLDCRLKSPDARTRWGATRVFNQHFKELTGDPELLAALEGDLNDSVPFVRFQAASGLWRWYYWQVDQPRTRQSTLESLATRLNTETNPMVRRGLEESVYDLLDENTGYLGSWVRATSQDDDKNRIQDWLRSCGTRPGPGAGQGVAGGHSLGARRHSERLVGFSHSPLRAAPAQG